MTSEVRDVLRCKTAPGLLVERARQQPARVAYRAKKLGIYRERTWREYAALVGRAADGLAKLRLVRGERVAIIGDACGRALARRTGFHHLYIGHHRPSEGRALLARSPPCRHLQHRRALSAARRAAAYGRVSAALPRPWPRCRHHAAPHERAGAALR